MNHVLAGDVIARMDDRQLRSDKSLFRQEVKELVDEASQWKGPSVENADVDATQSVQRAWQYEQSQLTSLLQSSLAMPDSETTTNREPVSAPPELPPTIPEATRNALARLREARQTVTLRWEEIQLRSELLEIRAPISGTLVALHCWPGQAVPQGGRIATIAADYGQHIVSYLPEDSRLDPEPGMQVTLRPRTPGATLLTSEIEQVGRQIEHIPARYLLSPTSPQWGIPVRIKMPSDASLRPGATVDVVFSTAG
jgi:multidrug resistance efflux pump